MKVAVVMGGASPEHQVSLASGRGIAKAVDLLGHTAIPMVIDAEGNWVDGQHEAIEILQASRPCMARAARTARSRVSCNS